ncbi:MAG TPA: carotenoid 1,2-hydratase [Sphingomonas sp.]|jgi:predicted secreted hydrolase|uniref:lipocalin-like domain-containing protein n=1 Tax=Sphingomonas sp. TaxID=28214 RepID=UPI002EDAC43E
MRALFRLLALLLLAAAAPATDYPVVRPGVPIAFPADHGAHPAYRTEWWYATGWLRTADGEDLGFQVTFFRSRLPVDSANRSAFAPRQLIFAHAGLSDPATGRLLHDQRAARAGFGLAQAATGDAAVAIRDWQFRRLPDGRFTTHVPARGFTLALAFTPTQPPMLQGVGGYSRKGPDPADASHYYSVPQLRVAGTVLRGGKAVRVTGTAWLDREWSSRYLDPRAAGWDWTGLNLEDGSALMAFRIRGRTGGTLWAGGSLRRPDGRIVRFAPGDVTLTTRRRWRSPATGAVYPVDQELAVRLPEGVRRFRLTPLFDAQELDGRAGGLPVYWEGAVRTRGGRGYLELTGYVTPLAI